MNYPKKPGFNMYESRHCANITCSVKTWFLKSLSKNMINQVEFGSTKSQRQKNAANPDVRNEIKTISAFLLCQTHISLFPTAHSTFPSSWLNIFSLSKYGTSEVSLPRLNMRYSLFV